MRHSIRTAQNTNILKPIKTNNINSIPNISQSKNTMSMSKGACDLEGVNNTIITDPVQ